MYPYDSLCIYLITERLVASAEITNYIYIYIYIYNYIYICIVFVNILHDLKKYCFFVVHAYFQLIRNTERLVVGAQKGIFSQIHCMVQNNIGLLLSIHKPFLVEIEL